MDTIDATLFPNVLFLVMQSRDKGASSWLNAIPLKVQSLALKEQEFTDSLQVRYHPTLNDLLSLCARAVCFSVNHTLSCKKRRFLVQRRDGVHNFLTTQLGKVCKNVEKEPHLQPLTTRNLIWDQQSEVLKRDWDTRADGFWLRGATAFFDVRITHVNSKFKQGRPTQTKFQGTCEQKEKKMPTESFRCSDGLFYPSRFRKQWRNRIWMPKVSYTVGVETRGKRW